jgi:hypothetical protein
MDELLIDEKKYVSSKQAAKITGYAKDYIGQLCREGRVPARLVGRSWYVLESAIQDHRFGDEAPKHKELPVQAIERAPASSWTRQAPRYEAAPVELYPKMREAVTAEEEPVDQSPEVQAPENLQNSWRAWFDRVGDTISSATLPTEPEVEPEPLRAEEVHREQVLEQQIELQEPVAEHFYTQEEVQIPIHTVYDIPPRELLPRYAPEEEDEPVEPPRASSRRRGGNRAFVRTIRIGLILVAILFSSLAIISTGYFDNYLSSSSQAKDFTGIFSYKK